MSSNKTTPSGPSRERILAFTMLDQMGGASNEQKCFRLDLCGFSNAEISELLQISVSSVSTNIHAAKKKAGPTSKSSKRSTSAKKAARKS